MELDGGLVGLAADGGGGLVGATRLGEEHRTISINNGHPVVAAGFMGLKNKVSEQDLNDASISNFYWVVLVKIIRIVGTTIVGRSYQVISIRITIHFLNIATVEEEN